MKPPPLSRALVLLLSWFFVACDGKEDDQGKGGSHRKADGGETGGDAGWKTTEWAIPRGGATLQGRVHDPVPRNPKVKWDVELDGPIIADAAIADGTIYVGSVLGTFYALDVADGSERWKIETEDTIEAPPTVGFGKVFIGSTDRFFYCLDQETGKEIWKYEAADKFVSGSLLVRSPDDKEDWVIVNGYDGSCRALRVGDGSEAWTYETAEQINGTPALVEGKTVVLGGCDMVVHSVNIANGEGLNEVPVDAEIIGNVATMGPMVYCANYANQLVAVEASGKEPTWIYEDKDFGFYASPAVGDEMVFIGSRDKHMHAVNRKTGVRAWKVKTGSRIDGAALVFDDAVVFGSGDARLYALNPKDGSEIWRLDLGEGIASDLAFANGQFVVGGTNGHLFCIEGQQGKGNE